MIIVNLTPHTLRIFEGDTATVEIPPTGVPARVSETIAPLPPLLCDAADIPLVSLRQDAQLTGLPAPTPNTLFVVSRVAAFAVTGRDDVLFPYDEVRNAENVVIGCRALARVDRSPDAEDAHA